MILRIEVTIFDPNPDVNSTVELACTDALLKGFGVGGFSSFNQLSNCSVCASHVFRLTMRMIISFTLNERMCSNARVVSYLQHCWYRYQHSYQLVDYSGVSYLFTCYWMVSDHVFRVFNCDLLSPGLDCINPTVRLCPLT